MNLPIPALYRAYARMTYSGRCGTYKNGRPANESGVDDRYYCLSCGANFKVEHRPVPMTYGYDDTDVICPVCGRLHSRRPPGFGHRHTGPVGQWGRGPGIPVPEPDRGKGRRNTPRMVHGPADGPGPGNENLPADRALPVRHPAPTDDLHPALHP